MHLTRFAVKNYKCLADIDIPLTPIHVIIGENDTGKTSLLEAIERLYWSNNNEKIREFYLQDTTSYLFCGHHNNEYEITFSGKWDLFKDGLWDSIDFPYAISKKNDAGDAKITIQYPKEGRVVKKDFKYQSMMGNFGPLQGFSAQIKDEYIERFHQDIVDCLESVQRYALQARILSQPSALATQDQQCLLQPDGFGLPSLLDSITDYDPELFIKIRKQFCRLFPQYQSIRQETAMSALSRQSHTPGLPFYSYGQGTGKTFYLETTDGARFNPDQVSDGVLLVLAYLAIAYSPNQPRLILLEEPENGIYPKRLAQVIGLLKSLAGQPMDEMNDDMVDLKGKVFPQIIMTTHSPYVLSFFKPEEATYLSRDPDTNGRPVRARPFRDVPNIDERLGNGEFYLGELWYNLDEKELFGN